MRSCAGEAQTPSGFNEAPVARPEKYGQSRRHLELLTGSMRLRSRDRRNPIGIFNSPVIKWLQLGSGRATGEMRPVLLIRTITTCFNEAPVARPEKCAVTAQGVCHDLASMRLRSRDRRNKRSYVTDWRLAALQ